MKHLELFKDEQITLREIGTFIQIKDNDANSGNFAPEPKSGLQTTSNESAFILLVSNGDDNGRAAGWLGGTRDVIPID